MNMHVATPKSYSSEQPDFAGTFEPPIGLLNAYSTRNLGDASIMAALAQLAPARSARAVIRDARSIDVPGVSIGETFGDSRRFVSVGGDIFNNARAPLVTRSFLSNVLEIRREAERAIVFGQTIPSSCGWLGLSLLSAALRQTCGVVVRDRESHDLLRRKGVPADLSYDTAFVLKPSESGILSAAAQFANADLCRSEPRSSQSGRSMQCTRTTATRSLRSWPSWPV